MYMFSKFHIIIFNQINHYYPNGLLNNVTEVTSKKFITKCVESWLKNGSELHPFICKRYK